MARRGERLLRAVSQTPWAIMPEKLEAILDVIEFRLAGVDLSADTVRGQFRPADRAVSAEEGGVAVLPLVGVISHRMNMMSKISGGTSTEKFGARFDELMSSQDISTIVIDVDSPGGTVEGVEELSRKIFEARDQGDKRIIAVANSLMASAAYWIGSAADEVVITPTGQAGSIGVFSVHTEFSEMEEEAGITRTLVKAGEFKAEANDFQPLSDEAENHLQETVDEYFDLFVEGVARNRGITEAAVRSGLGRGRVLPARQAVDEGLVDRIASFEEVLEELGVEGASPADIRGEAGDQMRPAASANGDPRDVELRAGDTEKEATMSADGDIDDKEGPEKTDAPEASSDESEDENQGAAEREGGRRQFEDSRETAAQKAVKEENMSKENDTASGDGAAAVQTDGKGNERERAARITRLCSLHGLENKAPEWIAEGLSLGEVQDRVVEIEGSRDEPIDHEPKDPAGLSEEDSKRYSLARAIRSAAQGDQMPDGFELDVHQELESKLGGTRNGGFLVPTHLGPLPDRFQGSRPDVARPRAALDTGTATEGQEFVFTEPGSFIEMLRARMVTTRLGATFLPGLEGNVSFPKQTGAGTFTWRAEEPGSDVSDSQATTDQVQLQPNDGTSSTAYSRRLLAQSVINVEQFIREDLAAIAGRGIDKAALHGAGGNEPTGIYNASSVNAVSFGSAGPTWPNVVKMETEVAADDADIGTMAYATTPEVRGDAKTTEKASNTAQFLWEGSVREGEMNGFRAMASNQFEKTLGTGGDEHGMVFGVWDQLLVGEWGALEIVVDPYSMKKQGLVEVTLFVIADVALRHPEAFSKATELIPS